MSYDEDGLGWTGSPLTPTRPRPTACDRPGSQDALRPRQPPLARERGRNELTQRQAPLDCSADDTDWVLQIDTDEVLPDFEALLAGLRSADDQGWDGGVADARALPAALRPRLPCVAGKEGGGTSSTPGPSPCARRSTLTDARRPTGRTCDPSSGRRQQPAGDPAGRDGEDRSFGHEEQAILHNSWGRSPTVVLRKVRSWGHYAGWRSWWYFFGTWCRRSTCGAGSATSIRSRTGCGPGSPGSRWTEIPGL